MPSSGRWIKGPDQQQTARILRALSDLRDGNNRSVHFAESDSVLCLLGNSTNSDVLLYRDLGRTAEKIRFSEVPNLHLCWKRHHVVRVCGSLRMDRKPGTPSFDYATILTRSANIA